MHSCCSWAAGATLAWWTTQLVTKEGCVLAQASMTAQSEAGFVRIHAAAKLRCAAGVTRRHGPDKACQKAQKRGAYWRRRPWRHSRMRCGGGRAGGTQRRGPAARPAPSPRSGCRRQTCAPLSAGASARSQGLSTAPARAHSVVLLTWESTWTYWVKTWDWCQAYLQLHKTDSCAIWRSPTHTQAQVGSPPSVLSHVTRPSVYRRVRLYTQSNASTPRFAFLSTHWKRSTATCHMVYTHVLASIDESKQPILAFDATQCCLLRSPSEAHLEFVGDHVAQALVVDRADVDVGRKLLPRHTADQRLACAQHSLPGDLPLQLLYIMPIPAGG